MRLQSAWGGFQSKLIADDLLVQYLSQDQLEGMDLFDRLQLKEVIKVCQASRSMAEAGRALFNARRDKNPPSTILIA